MIESTERQHFTLTELCDEFGLTARAIRFYETKGLVSPGRKAGARLFSRADRARLKLVLKGKRFRFSLVEIKHLLDLYNVDDSGAIQRKAALKEYHLQADQLRETHSEISSAITEIEASIQKMRAIQMENDEI